MSSPETHIMAAAMPKETRSVLDGLQIKAQGEAGLEMAFQRIREPISYNIPLSAETETTLADFISTSEESAFSEFAANDKTEQISNLLSSLSETERQVLYKKYYEGKTNTEISAEYGRSRDFASKVHAAALSKIRNNPASDHLRDNLD
jgi:DNA-directed RNA polymerase sigma subunit (sigma70/sigma32)